MNIDGSNRARLSHVGLNLGSSDTRTHDDAQSPMFGFWVFLMSDAVVFALLFAIYGTMLHATAGGPGARQIFDLKSAFTESLILLMSSFTFGMASLCMKFQRGNVRRLVAWLIVTLALGLAFVGFELNDFLHMIDQGAVPQRSGFLSALFTLVPTHGLHVTLGCLWIMVMLVQLHMYGTTPPVKTRIMRLALFWHFLDIVWVGIFSVVFIQGLA